MKNNQYLLTNHNAENRVSTLTLHRPEALNALSAPLMNELAEALQAADKNANVGCIVITGNEKAFAAGADIKGMVDCDAKTMQETDLLANWSVIDTIQTPVIAAVNGYALGGGFELAMACDCIVAGSNATFGLPEVSIGVIPGAGGTQRLTRAVGKALAMKLILTGQSFSAQQALDWKIAGVVCPPEDTVNTALILAEKIGSLPAVAVQRAKQCIVKASEANLTEGLAYERNIFYSLFDTPDQKEGMRAFIEKRKPVWQHQ
ncbi:MAG: enoyl-CoA hydratase-related protein [Cyanobacteria bacterium P01_H01_bin.74]